MANRLYIQLMAIKEGKGEGLNTFSGLDVVLYQGVLSPAQSGHLVLNNERLFFHAHRNSIVGAQNSRFCCLTS